MKKISIIFICLFGIFVPTAILAAAPLSYHYKVVIDAGSTGSRVHLFQYSNENEIPVINDVFSESVSPGIASFVNNPDGASQSLKKLFDDVQTQLQTLHVDSSQVVMDVLGTAGMRLIPDENQKAIYANIADYLRSNYSFQMGEINTISGKMEGVYGWLDINYLLNSFASDNDTTVGNIDMGGASTEIAFSTTSTSQPADEINLKIAGKNYTVYSKSFLGLGQDAIRATVNADSQSSICYPAHYVPSALGEGNYSFTGCSALYSSLLQPYHIPENLVPTANHKFIAYSGAFYDYNFFGVDQTPDQSAVERRVQEVCNLTWDEMKKAYPSVSEKYLANYCANETYLDVLFYQSYQLHDGQLEVETQINSKAIDWTLGSVFYTLLKGERHGIKNGEPA